MALTRIDLKCEINKSDSCGSLYLEDTTGAYNAVTNPEGYGMPNGILSNDVTEVIAVLNYETLGTYITYTFTVLLGVVQSVTLSIEGGTPVNISTAVGAIPWPFVSTTQFELTKDYGVTLPELKDGVYSVDYTISGESTQGGGTETFSYTESEQFVLCCQTECCISKMYASLDPACNCSDKKQALADEAYSWLQAAKYAAEYGKVDEAVLALKKASDLCDCNCKGC